MGSLFPKPPTPEPVTPMPDPDSPEAQAARRKEMQKALARSGRASTLLSGGGTYSSPTLGTR